MTTKTTGELLEELKDKSAFKLAWSVIWRWAVLVMIAYAAMGLLGALFAY